MQIEVRLAEERDIPALCEVWKTCFSDSEAYIRYFYRENFDRMIVRVVTADGKVVCIGHAMPAVFADGEDEYPVLYTYAGATLPAYRRKGLLSSLHLDCVRWAKENGVGLFNKPLPTQVEYYASLGLMEDSRFRIFAAEPLPDGRRDVSFAPLSAEEYNRLRNAAFSDRPYVKWPDAHVRWCVDENAFCGGRTLLFSLDGSTHFLMGCPSGGVLRVTETDLRPEQLRQIAPALCELFGTASLEAFLPWEDGWEGPSVVASRVLNAPMRHTYANLLLF